jgi:hypothetical protein
MNKNKNITQETKDLSGYHVEVLSTSWNDRLLEMCRQSPVRAGNLNIHFDRSPDIFTIPRNTSYFYRPLGFFNGEKLIGFAIATYQKRNIKGTITDVIYLGNMHVTERGTGHIFLKKLTERVVQIVQDRPEVKYLYAYVMEGNRSAKRLANMGQLSSKPMGSISMSTIFTLKPVALNDRYLIRKATLSDVDTIVELLSNEHKRHFLSPEINREVFLNELEIRPGVNIENYYLATRDDKVVGLCLAWNMTSFKKNRIRYNGYKMKLLRQLYNLVARLTGSPQLPGSGEAFKDITIAEHAVLNRDPEILESLLRYIYREYREKGFQTIIIGCSSDDPIIQATRPFLSREVRSKVIIAPLQKDSKHSFRDVSYIYADSTQI